MHMDNSGGVLSVPSDHYWGLVALVASPIALWLVVCAGQALAHREVPMARSAMARLSALPTAAKAALVASFVGGVVHAVLVRPHWEEDRTRALLFVASAVGFAVAFGWTLAQRPYWRAASLLASGSTVGGYAYYILGGLEHVDLVGLITTTVELAAALVLLAPEPAAARSAAAAHPSARWRERWILGAALPLALVSVLGMNAIATTSTTEEEAGEHAHAAGHTDTADHADADAHSTLLGRALGRLTGADEHGAHGMKGMNMAGAGVPVGGPQLWLPTTSPAGPIVWPVAMGAMEPGMKMVTPHCTARPSAAQQRAAVRLVDRTVRATEKYRSLAAAKAAGYVPVTPTGMRVVHYINYSAYLEGKVLDPSAIPVLVYVNTAHGAVLSAAMYMAPNTAVSQPGGCLTQWHIHTNLCFADAAVVALTDQTGDCPNGTFRQVTQPMMHVWLTPVTGGPLSMDPSTLSQLVAAEKVPALPRPNGTA